MSDFFIAGTDTGVGKTYITCQLLRDLRARGINAGVYKPVCCGDRADARLLRDAAFVSDSLECINPVYLRACAEPLVSAELERKSVSVANLVQQYRQVSAQYDTVLVEGTNGWETPLSDSETMADLAEQLQLPVLLVVKNQRGAASLAMIHVLAIQQRGLTCHGIILNHIEEEWDTASVTNRALIEKCTGIPVLAELIHGQDRLDSAEILGC